MSESKGNIVQDCELKNILKKKKEKGMKRLPWLVLISLTLVVAFLFSACAQSTPTTSQAPLVTSTPTASSNASPKTTTSPTVVSSPKPTTAANTIVLRMGYTTPQGTPPYNGWEWFAQELEKQSQGQMKLELYPGGTLVQAGGQVDAVRNGVVSLILLNITLYTSDWPLLTSYMLPTIQFPDTVDGMAAGGNAIYSIYNEFPEIQAEMSPDVKIIAAVSISPYFYFGKTAMRGPDDLKGVKVGGSFGPYSDLVKAAGGTAVNVPLPNAYMSLQTGVTSGQLASWSSIQSYKFWEVAKYGTDDMSFGRIGHMVAFNKKLWDSLTSDQQKLIMSLIPETQKKGYEGIKQQDDTARQNFAKNGSTIIKPTAAEMALWVPVKDSIERKWLDDMKAKNLTSAPQVLARLKQLASQASK